MSSFRHFILIAGLNLATLMSLAFSGCTSPTPTAAPVPPASHQELARHYAPVIRQGVASDQDFITAVDFDGDWVGNNNWENQPAGDLSARVYYSVIETETHWFLFYALFHPRDYTRNPCEKSEGCHENDMESIQMVVVKDGTPFGKLLAVETLAHSDIYLYAADPSVKGSFLKVRGSVRLEGSHPIVYIETYGHGIYAHRKILVPHVVVYRVGEQAEAPESLQDDSVSYQLVSIYDTLWMHRDEIGPGQAFDQPFDYRGYVLPSAIDGDNYGQDRANTPWGYNQATGDTLSRGDWFLDPAKALTYHAHFEGEFSQTYLNNPYLDDLGALR
ncbi:MAG: hypothetical protein H8E47_08785 [Anaerolineales bacterium]|nr:hypothetical protein [Anaerolineales bacterium]